MISGERMKNVVVYFNDTQRVKYEEIRIIYDSVMIIDVFRDGKRIGMIPYGGVKCIEWEEVSYVNESEAEEFKREIYEKEEE